MKTIEQKFAKLTKRVNLLERIVNELIRNCHCTIPERMGGHHEDCPVPFIHGLKQEFDYDNYCHND